jgi:ABC-2 type transport system ATP-binding protein
MTAAIIEARDLVKRFDGFTAVDHISFAVEAGVIFGFLGLNGAGRTTTIKMLTTVLTPSEGRLSIAGHDPVKEPLLVRSAFGIVFQDPSLDDQLTAAENMELHGVLYGVPRVERRERVEALLRFVGLWERRDDYVKRFSGGMKRRLEIPAPCSIGRASCSSTSRPAGWTPKPATRSGNLSVGCAATST